MKPDLERKAHTSAIYEDVAGERAAPVIAQALSLQTRFSNYIAFGLVALVGAALLLWYYTHASKPLKIHAQAQLHTVSKTAADDVALPSLGPIRVPFAATAAVDDLTGGRKEGSHDPPGSAPPLSAAASAPILRVMNSGTLAQASATGPTLSHAPSAGVSSYQRRMSGDAYVAGADSASGEAALTAPLPSTFRVPEPSTAASAKPGVPADALVSLLSHASTPIESAAMLPTRSLLLPKGAFIDCTLETAIDSTLPGMTTCVTATDTFGADGRVVLLERGTRLIGETRGEVQQGSSRVFVLWTEARTPLGVIVPLDSPGTDELGRSGLPGQIDRHFWQRFGAAVLLSVIDGAVQAGVQASAANGGGAIIYNPSGSQDVMTEILKGTISIPPTVTKRNGDRIQILVARDVDFRDVYELKAAGSTR